MLSPTTVTLLNRPSLTCSSALGIILNSSLSTALTVTLSKPYFSDLKCCSTANGVIIISSSSGYSFIIDALTFPFKLTASLVSPFIVGDVPYFTLNRNRRFYHSISPPSGRIVIIAGPSSLSYPSIVLVFSVSGFNSISYQ